MPLYVFKCSVPTCTSEEFEELLKMSEMELPLEIPCKNCGGKIQQCVTSGSSIDPIRLGISRPPAGFSGVLDRIKKAHPNGHYNSRFSPLSER